MENKSLIANLIAKCEQEIVAKCQKGNCPKCKYWNMCRKVTKLNEKFKTKGYLK